MDRLIFILAISFGSIAAGYGIRRFAVSHSGKADETLRSISRRLKLAAFFFLNPVALLSTFWALRIPDPRVLALPLLGLFSFAVGIAGALAAIRILKVPAYRAGSLFTCGSYGNVLTMGGLVAYAIFREPGYGLVQLFALFLSSAYYVIGYPMSANIGGGRRPIFKFSIVNIKENPFLMLPISAMALGFGLQATGLARPGFLTGIVGIIVPCVAATLGIAIGLTLRFTGFRSYFREITAIVVIRHMLLPLVMIPAALLLGLGKVAGGLPVQVIAIVSIMPVGFNSLGPPAIYGFDLDLANSAWITSTALLAVIVPILFLVFGLAL